MLRVLCNKGKLAIIIPEESHKHEHQGGKETSGLLYNGEPQRVAHKRPTEHHH